MGTLTQPLLVIGGGNMGRAIVEGAVRAGVLDPARVLVVEPDAAKHGSFGSLRIRCAAESPAGVEELETLEAGHGPGAVLLAVKPQMLPAVGDAAGGALRRQERLVMSILAGKTGAGVRAVTGGRVVRLMPNTPAQIGKGMTAVCAGPGATDEDLDLASRLFEAVGRVVRLPEDLLDAFTGVAGSGPAYIFYLAEGMVAGAEAAGFSREQALDLVRATVSGAAALLDARTDLAPEELRAMVTSKGGTTAAATGVLDQRGVLDAVRDAVVAARDRGRELA